MKTTADVCEQRALLRHCLAALAYRTRTALRDAPVHFATFQAGGGVRTPLELLHHMTDVLMLTADGLGGTESDPLEPLPFEGTVDRFHGTLQVLSAALESAPLQHDRLAERLLQGPISDTMTHVGQLALLRRLAGAPVRPEDFFRASISSENLGPHQSLSGVEPRTGTNAPKRGE